MSAILLHDTGDPGKLGWVQNAVRSGFAAGFVVSFFDTPRHRAPRRPDAAAAVELIHEVGGSAYLDPETHGVVAPGADRFDHYDSWALWSGRRGDLSIPRLREHVERVIGEQLALGLTPIAPTLPLDSPLSAEASLAREMVGFALAADRSARITVVGSHSFWTAGVDLDGYIGDLATLQPGGWVIGVQRPELRYPWPGVNSDEVAGMARSTHTMSTHAEVIVLRGDFEALPCVAAGASLVGSGWHLRQRVGAHSIYRDSTRPMRQSERITHEGLLASMKRQEAERLRSADAGLSAQLVPGSLPPDRNERWWHHLRVLDSAVNRLLSQGNRQAKVNELRDMYQDAISAFVLAEPLAHPLEAGPQLWLTPYVDGLEQYAAAEGL